jgi:hypothetical protein
MTERTAGVDFHLQPEARKSASPLRFGFPLRSDINPCVSVLIFPGVSSKAKEFVVCQWSFVIEMAIDNS